MKSSGSREDNSREKDYTFLSIDRSEYSSLFDYLNSKDIKIKNPQSAYTSVGGTKAGLIDVLDLGEGSDDDEDEDDDDYEGGQSSKSGNDDDSGEDEEEEEGQKKRKRNTTSEPKKSKKKSKAASEE